MSLEIIHGTPRNIIATRELIESLKALDINGILYIGYPILASADESITVDALIIIDDIGLVIFHLPKHEDLVIINEQGIEKLQDIQDKLYFSIKNNLGRHENLRKRRSLAVEINIITYLPTTECLTTEEEVLVANKQSLKDILSQCEKTDKEYLPALNAAIQRVTTIKPRKKRENVNKPKSKGSKLKIIEKEIANLDRWQKQGAIETPSGAQRVRGLAGSGKTVVLALKAAYLHSQHSDWNIVVTFHTRSLYQQFRDLIRRFTFEHSNDEPDWSKLKILHTWGSRSQPGLYSEVASAIDLPVRDYLYGKTKYGINKAFDGVCKEISDAIKQQETPSLYDAILVDEAQDLPLSFFRMIYEFLTPAKQIIWAYDELQNLSDYFMPTVDILFGKNPEGQPNVSLVNLENEAHQDIILPVCYRNSPWALTLAHALGFGVYRDEGLVQLFDDDTLWNDIGYELIEGQLVANSEVVLKRKTNSYPKFFEELITADEAVVCRCFEDFDNEVNWIADQILLNINEDELDYDDILVILPSAWTAKSKANIIIQALRDRKIQSHLAGVSSSVDQIFIPQSIAIANIYRAKGNEAPMVYVVNTDHCSSGYELIKLRNSLFTAITRSRAWVCLTGSGEEMKKVEREFDELKRNDFSLRFRLPSETERARLRTIHRDRSTVEKEKIKRTEKELKQFIDMVKNEEIDISNLPTDIREGLERILGEPED